MNHCKRYARWNFPAAMLVHASIRATGIILAVITLVGCAHHPVNQQLVYREASQAAPSSPQRTRPNSDELLVILAFSGGGARASALSYGVLEELARTTLSLHGQDRRLLDEVDLISAVSGGSFTAAYYGLFGDRIFTEFEQRYLKKNVKGALLARMLSPITWLRLASPYFHRSDLAAEYYDKHIFDGGTFADISARGTRVIINATDMTDGKRFGFDPEQFGWICSDLMRFPVSRAVAASSAVPVVLSPVTVRNYAEGCDDNAPDRFDDTLRTRQKTSGEDHQATSSTSYLNRAGQPYIHLYDGGVSDNLGLRAVIDTVKLAGGASQAMLQYEEFAKAKKIIFVVVNAETTLDRSWAQSGRGPSSKAVLLSSANVQLNRYSFETITLLRSSFQEWKKQIAQSQCSASREMRDTECESRRFYLTEVSFDALADEQERAYLKRLSSAVTLPASDVDRLRKAAAQILGDSNTFKSFLQDVDKTQNSILP